MMKRIIALVLCLTTLLSVCLFAGCGKSEDDNGAYITMYLTDEIYDFDPANAYYNTDTFNVVSLLFDTLFKLDENGNVQKSLVKDYKFSFNDLKKEYKLVMTLNKTYWSDGNRVSAEDVVFAWKRILDWESSFACASLLYDVKNARAVKAGNESIDQLGVKASGDYEVTVEFEYAIDQDQFLLNLTSLALAPLRESDVTNKGVAYEDWAKKPGFLTSGPFKVTKVKYPNATSDKDDPIFDYGHYYDINGTDESGKPLTVITQYPEARLQYFVLERNTNYYREKNKDALDKAVTPYQILCDCTRTGEDVLQAYKDGKIFYVGDIPFSVRNDSAYASVLSKVQVTDALSTFILAPNENATVKYSYIETEEDGYLVLYDKNGNKLRYNSYTIKTDENGVNYINFTGVAQNKNPYYEIYSKQGKIDFDENGLKIGDKLFANTNVRQALSLSIDREAIAKAVVYAKAATGLVSSGVFATATSKGDFRKISGNVLATSADLDAAKELLNQAGINPSDYAFTITVNANDDVHVAVAEMVAEAWGVDGLGFHVNVFKLGAIVNNDLNVSTGSIPSDIADNLFTEAIQNTNYDVIAYDYTAYSADALGQLAPFATFFSGNGVLTTSTTDENGLVKYQYSLIGSKIGYQNEEYDLLIEAAYFLQYYRNISTAANSNDYKAFGFYDKAITNKTEAEAAGREAFNTLMSKVADVYAKYDISTDKNLENGRAKLLAEAEKLLLTDMAVIPVYYNQNAILIANDLNNVTSTYYVPAMFQKATLYRYSKYVKEFSVLLK